jgi:7-cyano-7-deazaguanine synthase
MKVTPIVSGGLDSITMLYQFLANGDEITRAISFDYGQRHLREVEAAAAICARVGVPHELVSIADDVLGGKSALTGEADVPDGHYAEDSMRQTIVPGRNLVMLAIAASYAMRDNSWAVAMAVHAGDHFVYPDCRPAFIEAARNTLLAQSERSLTLVAPFLHADKTEIARLAAELGVPIADTWSCYKGGDTHCGTCGTCVERREAMMLAQVDDPTPYLATPPIPAAPR